MTVAMPLWVVRLRGEHNRHNAIVQYKWLSSHDLQNNKDTEIEEL